jgi:N-acetyl-alpha-D-muramate 1-phosphate uridylyltransferase
LKINHKNILRLTEEQRKNNNALQQMQAMILSAGLGTRFKPWTEHHPKALAIVNGKSLLQRNIEYLQQFGIREVIVNVHHFADQIIEAIEKNRGWGSHVMVSDEKDEVLETGGGLLKAKELFHGSKFVILNVDILTDANLDQMLTHHLENDALITLATTERKTSRYLLFNENNRLCGWRNTSTGEEKISMGSDVLIQKAYSGLAIMNPEVLNLIPFTGKFSLIDVYLSLAAANNIFNFDHSGGKLVDVGRTESVQVAENLFP